jgi:serine/threonine protein kinase
MTNDFLTRSRDQIIEGTYRLGAVLHHSSTGAVYQTEFGDDARLAAIKIRRADTPDSEALLTRWRNAIELSHPNLLRVYAAGSSVLNGIPVIYVVMERAEESLAGVLAERPLSEAETHEMLAPTLAALRYLHKKGYAHTNLRPSNILAIGDLLKLSSDSAARNAGSPADDMRALGAVIVEALTQEPPKMEEDGSPYILRAASEPFTDIVRHCLDPDPARRWTADQVAARLNWGANAAVETAAPRDEKTVRSASPLSYASRDEGEDRQENRFGRKWIYAGFAALVLIVLLFGLLRRKEPGPAAAAIPIATKTPPAETLPPPDSSRSQPATLPSPPRDESKPSADPLHVSKRAVGNPAEGWAVVAATYGSRGPAEKRMREMTRRWPKFEVSVVEQDQAGKTYYLVTLGQNLSENRADSLRKSAVASGLPRDTYIKKF